MSNIYLEVNGLKYDGFTDINVSRSIENLAGQFSFSTTVKDGADGVIQNDLKVQDEVKVYIDEDLILTGYIEELNISYSTNDHSISVSGRDKTGDLIDSSIIPKLYKQTDFIKMANAVLKDNGYSDIKIINNIKKLPILTVGETKSATDMGNGEKSTTEQGDTIASYLDRYAKKVQALLITDEDGNINITSEGDQLAIGDLISSGDRANILSASINISSTERFRYLEIYSQSNNDSFSTGSVSQSALVLDNDIRNPRRKRISLSTATNSRTLLKLANWNVNIRRAKGLRYNCTVQDFYSARTEGFLWLPNTLVQIKDDKCQLDGQYLIQGVTYRKDKSGSFTDLSIVEIGSFSAEPQVLPESKIGENLINILAP